MMSCIRSNDGSLSVIIGGKPYNVGKEHINYDKLVDCIRGRDEEEFTKLVNISQSIKTWAAGSVEVKDGQVFYNGEAMHNVITDRILGLMQDDLPHDGMLLFLKNLMDNPSRRAREELYPFLEHKGLPITDDGCFLAYKAVREDWMDKHSGTFNNAIGQKITMQRSEVDDDARRGCSYGFHVGDLTYVRDFHGGNGKMLIVKVNPKDVVAVPYEDARKVRVCEYEVIEEFKEELSSPMYTASVNNVKVWEEEDEDEDEDWGDEEQHQCDNCGGFTYSDYSMCEDCEDEEGY